MRVLPRGCALDARDAINTTAEGGLLSRVESPLSPTAPVAPAMSSPSSSSAPVPKVDAGTQMENYVSPHNLLIRQ